MDDQRPDSWPVNLAVAALTGVTTAYLPVHRWSPAARWTMHGGMGVLTGAATAYVVSRPEKPTDLGDTGDIASVRPGPGTLAAIGLVLAVVVTGLSRGGEAADAWMERGLTRRGVGRPRAWMGVAAAGASLAMSVAERRQAPREPGATTPPPAAWSRPRTDREPWAPVLTAHPRPGERLSMSARHLVATVLVEPSAVEDLELRVMTEDLWLWPVRTAPVVVDGARMEFQLRRRLVEQRQGAWDDAVGWTPVWVGFGDAWHEFGPEGNVRPTGPLPWAAHQRLWCALEEFAPVVRYRRRLSGIPTVPTSQWPGLHVR